MIQHVLLLTVAAPLIVLGRAVDVDVAAAAAAAAAAARRAHGQPLAPVRAVRALGRWLGRPSGAWIAFSVDLVAWHIPAAYDRDAATRPIHDLEHTTFLLFGILLWAQVLDSPPLRIAAERRSARVYYIIGAAVVGWVLSLVLAFAPAPLYPAYAHLAHRPGGISALADQQIAAGVMLVPGSLTMTLFVFVGLYRWLGPGQRRRAAAPPPVSAARHRGAYDEPMTVATRAASRFASPALACALLLGLCCAGCGSSSSAATSSRPVDRRPGLQGLILNPPKPAPPLALRNYTGRPGLARGPARQGRPGHVRLHALPRRVPADRQRPRRRPARAGREGEPRADRRRHRRSEGRHACGGARLPRRSRRDRAHGLPARDPCSADADVEGLGRRRDHRHQPVDGRSLGGRLRHHGQRSHGGRVSRQLHPAQIVHDVPLLARS